MPGASAPAAARVVVVNTRVSHHGYAKHPAFPHAMVLTGSYVLFPATGLVCRRRRRKFVSVDLMPASGHQNHTPSPSASAPFVKGASASTASRSNVRDDGQRPSSEQDGQTHAADLGESRSGIFFRMGLDDPNHVDPLQQISLRAQVPNDGLLQCAGPDRARVQHLPYVATGLRSGG
jgi:hypothetical protein